MNTFAHGWNEGDLDREHAASGYYDGPHEDQPSAAELAEDMIERRARRVSAAEMIAQARDAARSQGMSDADAADYNDVIDFLQTTELGDDFPF